MNTLGGVVGACLGAGLVWGLSLDWRRRAGVLGVVAALVCSPSSGWSITAHITGQRASETPTLYPLDAKQDAPNATCLYLYMKATSDRTDLRGLRITSSDGQWRDSQGTWYTGNPGGAGVWGLYYQQGTGASQVPSGGAYVQSALWCLPTKGWHMLTWCVMYGSAGTMVYPTYMGQLWFYWDPRIDQPDEIDFGGAPTDPNSPPGENGNWGGDTSGDGLDWTSADGLFGASASNQSLLQDKLDLLRDLPPFGDIRESVEEGSGDPGTMPLSEQWYMPDLSPTFYSGAYDVSTQPAFGLAGETVIGSRPLDWPTGSGRGFDWANGFNTVGGARWVVRSMMGVAVYALFGVGLLIWAKGRVSV